MIQILIQGFMLSGLYALIAVGFTLIFAVGRVLNLAHGAYIMLGGYAYYFAVHQLHMPKLAGCLFAIVIGTVAGLLMYRFLVKRLEGNQVAVEISTLIVAVVVQAAIVVLFTGASKILLPVISGIAWRVGFSAVTYNMLLAVIASWVVMVGLFLFVKYTHLGRAVLAVSMDTKGAQVSGINTDRINLLTWAISGGLAALAGVFFATLTSLSPGMWVQPLIIAVAVVIVGGIGSIVGSLIVAHIIGFLEVITTSTIAADLQGVVTMALIIAVLVLRPQGLFGRGEL